MEMVVVVLTAQALKNWARAPTLTALTRSHLVLPTYYLGDAASALSSCIACGANV